MHKMENPKSILFFKTIVLASVVLLVQSAEKSPTSQDFQQNKLLLVMYDGMRWDSITDQLPGMKDMMENGVHAKQLRPCYPSSSLANHVSILTGLYPETHGFLGNKVYNVTSNKTLSLDNMEDNDEPELWRYAQPIWEVAYKQGKRVKVYHNWMKCDVMRNGFALSHDRCDKTRYFGIKNLTDSMEEALAMLAKDELDFAAIYQANPDHEQHYSGFNSPAALAKIEELDKALHDLQENSSTLTMPDGETLLSERLNIMLVSDHGHMNVTAAVNVTPVFEKYPEAHILTIGTQILVWPRAHGEEIIEELKNIENMKVYRKEDIPERWHYKRGLLAPPILGVTDLGFYFISPDHPKVNFDKETQRELKSEHGHDNNITEMQAVFLARGPNFKKRLQIPILENVQLYQIMCSILGIEPSIQNGTWSMIESLVVDLTHNASVNLAHNASLDLTNNASVNLTHNEPVKPSNKAISVNSVVNSHPSATTKPALKDASFKSLIVTVVVAVSGVLVLSAAVFGIYLFKKRSKIIEYKTLPKEHHFFSEGTDSDSNDEEHLLYKAETT